MAFELRAAQACVGRIRGRSTILKRVRLSVFLLPLIGGMSTIMAQQSDVDRIIYVGVLATHDRATIRQEWMPTMQYLSAHLPGIHFVMLPVNLPELEDALWAHGVDFVLVHPDSIRVLRAEYGLALVATVINLGQGMPLSKFGGTIFVRRNRSDIRSLEDLRGKTIAISDRYAFDGFQIHQGFLRKRGIDVARESRLLIVGLPQARSVRAVLDGQADVGFVRTGVLESMGRAGALDLAQVRVLNEVARPDFPFRLSTDLHSEWVLASAPHVPLSLTKQVAAALLLMKPDDAAARGNHYAGWAPPLSPATRAESADLSGANIGGAVSEWRTMNRYLGRHVFEALLGIFSLFVLTLILLHLHARRVNHALQSSQRKLQVLAHHDALTGLPNRVLLEERLSLALAHAKRHGHEVAVCLLDLDDFKPINDTLGHQVGDRVLKEVADRIKGGLRESDMVARYGGDEFVLILDDLVDQWALREVVERVLTAVAKPLHCHPAARVRASIGVSVYPEDATDAFSLLKHADEAMYIAKHDGGNRFERYAQPALPPQPIRFRKV